MSNSNNNNNSNNNRNRHNQNYNNQNNRNYNNQNSRNNQNYPNQNNRNRYNQNYPTNQNYPNQNNRNYNNQNSRNNQNYPNQNNRNYNNRNYRNNQNYNNQNYRNYNNQNSRNNQNYPNQNNRNYNNQNYRSNQNYRNNNNYNNNYKYGYQEKKRSLFPKHLTDKQIQKGLSNKTIYEGTFNKFSDTFSLVRSKNFVNDIYVDGRNTNRALNGDTVYFKLVQDNYPRLIDYASHNEKFQKKRKLLVKEITQELIEENCYNISKILPINREKNILYDNSTIQKFIQRRDSLVHQELNNFKRNYFKKNNFTDKDIQRKAYIVGVQRSERNKFFVVIPKKKTFQKKQKGTQPKQKEEAIEKEDKENGGEKEQEEDDEDFLDLGFGYKLKITKQKKKTNPKQKTKKETKQKTKNNDPKQKTTNKQSKPNQNTKQKTENKQKTPNLEQQVSYDLLSQTISRKPQEYKIDGKTLPSSIPKNGWQNNYVLVKFGDWDNNSPIPTASFVKTLGEINNLENDINRIIHAHSLQNSLEFPEETLKEIEAIKEIHQDLSGQLEQRRDLRNLKVFTISTIEATDKDDAIHIQQLDANIFEVGIHIADVSYFIKPDSKIDIEAKKRGNTFGSIHNKIPMLPKVLSENLLSLNTTGNKLTYSVIVTFQKINNDDFTIIGIWVGRSIVNVRANLTYDIVDEFIENHYNNFVNADNLKEFYNSINNQKINKIYNSENKINNCVFNDRESKNNFKYKELILENCLLNQIAIYLETKRKDFGIMYIDKKRLRMNVNKETKEIELGFDNIKNRSISLVEQFGLLTNEIIAKKIFDAFPENALLRLQPEPFEKKIKQFCQAVNDHFDFLIDTSTIKTFYDSIQYLKKNAEPNLFQALLSRHYFTRGAEYYCSGDESIAYKRHYGLNIIYYTHFTSPIRRYSDIIVHRLLTAALEKDELENNENENEVSLNIPDKNSLKELTVHCNLKNRAKNNFTKEITLLYLNEYLKTKGEIHTNAIVTKIDRMGIYVYLPKFASEFNFVDFKEFKYLVGIDITEKKVWKYVWSKEKYTPKKMKLLVEKKKIKQFINNKKEIMQVANLNLKEDEDNKNQDEMFSNNIIKKIPFKQIFTDVEKSNNNKTNEENQSRKNLQNEKTVKKKNIFFDMNLEELNYLFNEKVIYCEIPALQEFPVIVSLSKNELNLNCLKVRLFFDNIENYLNELY
ncbi:ribonuclease [Anaeramoeba flamelloides]|uniref:Ribonuclease n=1 Tax=Anaeramoeba flamelloides TaxID=1746091 RepID=A0ABQ8X3Z5_9EUKA|nr:ribonuclease [Anaeramoeba flamelloides]